MDLVLANLQTLICHKTLTNKQTKIRKKSFSINKDFIGSIVLYIFRLRHFFFLRPPYRSYISPAVKIIPYNRQN